MSVTESHSKQEVTIKGKQLTVDAEQIAGKTIITRGRFPRIARITDEVCDDGVADPEVIVAELKRRRVADIFTFDQKLPKTEPKHPYYFEWDNVAVLVIESYDHWWNKQIKNDARRMVRKANKKGVEVRAARMNDELARGIKGIYDETPMRQGTPFWHYKKDLETVRKENSTFLERSEFIGAYHDGELIGFDKIFYTGERADQIQLLSMIKHREKSVTNALIAKAVEVCAEKGISYLTYGKYAYGKKVGDSLADFKQRNGFQRVDFPRYYVPLTLRGRIALRLKLHKRLIDLLPSALLLKLHDLRAALYSLKFRVKKP